MAEHRVDVFFYGSYINFKVLGEVGIKERPIEVGRVNGYELSIKPLANLRRKKQGMVYGILTGLTHAELDRLYLEHSRGILGGEYHPEAVIVYQLSGIYTPALCYISHNMKDGKADPEYVERILKPAGEYEFPKWYLNHIESFKS